ncbi:hypothetical protein IKS86_06410 [bacterium]|nr:hypothetical protein [bacterium]
MADRENKSIVKGMQHLILCEGKDAQLFMIYYLNSKALADNKQYSEVVQVEDFGGNEQLSSALKLWSKDPNFQNLKSLVVLRDSETDAQGAVDSIKTAFKKAELPVPSCPHQFETDGTLKTGFLLFPECSSDLKNGTLEDLCLSVLEESGVTGISEIDSFLSDLEKREIRIFPRRFKTRLHTYFSITDDFVSLKIGEAAKAGAFDWNSPKLDQIKSFLEEMIR